MSSLLGLELFSKCVLELVVLGVFTRMRYFQLRTRTFDNLVEWNLNIIFVFKNITNKGSWKCR